MYDGLYSVAHICTSLNFKKFVNSLRCPLCQSQLDGNVHSKEARLYCVSNNEEYSVIWEPDKSEPRFETINYYYGQYKYTINIKEVGDQFHTIIDRFDRDVTFKYVNSTRKRMFELIGSRLTFFRQRMEEEVFLNKLKLYNVLS